MSEFSGSTAWDQAQIVIINRHLSSRHCERSEAIFPLTLALSRDRFRSQRAAGNARIDIDTSR